jgi:hypothetical protein
LLLRAGPAALAHALAGLLAWMLVRLFPLRSAAPPAEETSTAGLGLRL